jgi:pyrroloquinoline-quinone synthase
MDLIERLDAVRDRWNVLRHPFYTRWERGELAREELAAYAGEYRHAVVALAAAARTAAPLTGPEHAAEEAAHVTLWDAFAHGLGADLTREPRPETRVCVDAWSGPDDPLEAAAILYAVEAGQPEISRTKLDGLVRHYGFVAEGPATSYFALHAERDVAHAAEAREILERHAEEADGDRLVRTAEAALAGNWTLLDGV